MSAIGSFFYDDFRSGTPLNDPNSKYAPFQSGGTTYDDAAGGTTVQKGLLQIRSTPFTLTDPSGLDHIKCLYYAKTPFQIPKYGKLVCQTEMALEQSYPNPVPGGLAAAAGTINGVTNQYQDIRLCAGAFNTADFATMMVYDFILSNGVVYVFYERLPFLRTEWGGPGPNYTAFSHAIPVFQRNASDPGNDYVKLAIVFDAQSNKVTWRVNGKDVYSITNPGHPIDQKYRVLEHNVIGSQPDPSPTLALNTISVGFGTFSLMDMTNPHNPGSLQNPGLLDLTLAGALPAVDPVVTQQPGGTCLAPTFLSPYNAALALFGQGATLSLKYISVTTEW